MRNAPLGETIHFSLVPSRGETEPGCRPRWSLNIEGETPQRHSPTVRKRLQNYDKKQTLWPYRRPTAGPTPKSATSYKAMLLQIRENLVYRCGSLPTEPTFLRLQALDLP